ncbi:hypothetical protein A3A66_01545 [Microgenomates group bacterium RIFCSPLOWO2_01_FULL_46_13]|nr:MAG: hypothetical protein A2783_00860 [Microgenomates group bacterium RIFCSPHIGHO2_01_FULL_45_11]OGV94680.1 MAG: hypothetical protein A3A66_01545 [Microgenomates group bacterium RIFCSPLOWO2_01_FULL_46_13]
MEIERAGDIDTKIRYLVRHLNLPHIDASRIIAFRSYGSEARARARIWSLPRIWQEALKVKAHYVIEVLSHHFDHLSEEEKLKVLIHELLHIPKTFSGALVPHRGAYRRYHIHRGLVEQLFKRLKKR